MLAALLGNNNNNIVETKQATAVASCLPHTSSPLSIVISRALNISRCRLSFALLWLG